MATEVAVTLTVTLTLPFGDEWEYTAPSGHQFRLNTLLAEFPLDLDTEPFPGEVVKVWGLRPDGRPAAPWAVHWRDVPNVHKDAMLEARRGWARGIWRVWSTTARNPDPLSTGG
jgi:hypothetical protein